MRGLTKLPCGYYVAALLAALALLFVNACTPVQLSRPLIDREECPPRDVTFVLHRARTETGEENSLAAILQAHDRKERYIELDVRLSADGTPFLFHNRRVERSSKLECESAERRANCPRDPASSTPVPFSELRDTEITRLAPERSPAGVPRLTEALDLLSGTSLVALLDLKGETPQLALAVIAEVQRRGVLNQIIIQCQRPETLAAVRVLSPVTSVLARVKSPEHLAFALMWHPTIIQPDPDWLTSELSATIHRSGSRILLKAVDGQGDTCSRWQHLAALGADLILTDMSQNQRR